MPTYEELIAAGATPVQAPPPTPGAGGSLTYEQLMAAGATPVEQAPAPEPGRLEALGRGAIQGATLGFGDEITGALESIFTDKKYQQARDEARAANDRARTAHGGFYGVGEAGGGLASAFVPGLGIAEGAGLGTVAAKSALAGGIGALGSSDKALSDVGGTLKDVGVGALTGAAGGALAHAVGSGVGKALAAAPEKVDEQTLKAVVGAGGETAAPWKVTKKALSDTNVPAVLNEKVDLGLPGGKLVSASDLAFEHPSEIRQVMKKQSQTLTDERNSIYDRADKSSVGVSSGGDTQGGIEVRDLLKRFDELPSEVDATAHTKQVYLDTIAAEKKKLLETYAPKLAQALDSQEAKYNPKVAQAVMDHYGGVRIPSKDLRSYATDVQNSAADASEKAVNKDVLNFIGNKTKDFVNESVEKYLGPEDAELLKSNNARTTALIKIDNILKEREAREAAGKFSGPGLLQRGLESAGNLGGAALVFGAHPVAGAATLAASQVLKRAPQISRFATTQAAKADQLLESISHAAAQGNPWAQAQIRAIRQTPVGAARLAQITSRNLLVPGAQTDDNTPLEAPQ